MTVDARRLPVERAHPVRLPRPPLADVALGALLAALSVFVTLTAPDTSPGQRLAAMIFGVLQTLPVLWRRSHPGLGLAVCWATKPVQYAAAVRPVSEWSWLVLAYSLFAYRPPPHCRVDPRADGAGGMPPSAAVLASVWNESFLGALSRFTLIVTAQLVVVAALGWAVQVTRTRAMRQREIADQARLAAAIGEERARIATELNSVVVARLHRVVTRTEQSAAAHSFPSPRSSDRPRLTSPQRRTSVPRVRQPLRRRIAP